ncbi:sensor histidine kinase [Dethiothermospora halolimnae]|uniref:sensor histidine kinase n=1 Tax=Dethiothermospora halolimnae TaxID=3114390 RepID=UPI003CCC0522
MKKRLNINKAVVSLILINIFQISVLLVILGYGTYLLNKSQVTFYQNGKFFVFIVIMIVLSNCVVSIRGIYLLSNLKAKYYMQRESFGQIEKLNIELRGQRHDFLNHLQVVHSLIEMEEYEDTRKYIEDVYEDINRVSRVLKTRDVAINALLQAKIQDCDNRNIKVDLEITSKLKELIVPSWEMCRILGNIIDNAIYSLLKKDNNRVLKVKVFKDLTGHVFKIIDNGNKIPDNIIENIFEPGFTTKGSEGDGMGLSIVKQIVSDYGGDITVNSDEGETTFTIKVPYKTKKL